MTIVTIIFIIYFHNFSFITGIWSWCWSNWLRPNGTLVPWTVPESRHVRLTKKKLIKDCSNYRLQKVILKQCHVKLEYSTKSLTCNFLGHSIGDNLCPATASHSNCIHPKKKVKKPRGHSNNTRHSRDTFFFIHITVQCL
jgi:hypothetical protein